LKYLNCRQTSSHAILPKEAEEDVRQSRSAR